MRGSVTVFFSLIFVTVLSVLGATIESARWASARLYWKQAANDSIISIFADYCAPLFKEYGLLFVDKTYGEDRDVIEEKFEEYISYNIKPSKGSIYKKSFLYEGEVSDTEMRNTILAIDGNGAVMRKSACEYMKYRIPANLVENFLEQFDFIDKAGVVQDFFDKIKRIENDMGRVDEAVTKINTAIEEIRELQESIENLADEVNELLRIKEPDKKIKRQLEDAKDSLLSEKQTVVELVDNILEQSEVYKEATETVREYLQNISDGWLERLDVPQEIKDVIRDEIENILIYSGGRDDVYGIEKNNDILGGLTDKLVKWSKNYTSGRFEELDVVEISRDLIKESLESVIGNFDAEALWEELQSEGMYAWLCPGYRNLSEAVMEPFYNRAYATYRAISDEYKFPEADTSIAEDIVFQEYMREVFSDYVNCEDNTAIKYELEYIIGGKTVDKENINVVINELLLLREAMNLVYIMCDSEKKEEAYSIAVSCLGFTGVFAAVKALQYLILTVWAFGEAMVDVRIIMSGGTVPVVKTTEDWRIELNNLPDIGKLLASISSPPKKNGIGDWTYEDYLKVLLYLGNREEQNLRAMDIMEANIQKNYSTDFRMVNCVYKTEITADFCLEPLFNKHELFYRKTTMTVGYSY